MTGLRKKPISYAIKVDCDNHSVAVNKNSLEDLILFDEAGSRLTRWDFLKEAMGRFERGEQVYSWAENGRLLGCIWHCERKNVAYLSIPADAVVLDGIYYHQHARNELKAFLTGVSMFILNGRDTNSVYVIFNGILRF
jgi:hypothetical protein